MILRGRGECPFRKGKAFPTDGKPEEQKTGRIQRGWKETLLLRKEPAGRKDQRDL